MEPEIKPVHCNRDAGAPSRLAAAVSNPQFKSRCYIPAALTASPARGEVLGHENKMQLEKPAE